MLYVRTCIALHLGLITMCLLSHCSHTHTHTSLQVSSCQNHLRVYEAIPGTDLVLVCGSGATISSECITVRVRYSVRT